MPGPAQPTDPASPDDPPPHQPSLGGPASPGQPAAFPGLETQPRPSRALLADWWSTITRRPVGHPHGGPKPEGDGTVPGPGDEVVEHIPWERLTVTPQPRRGWVAYLLGAVVLMAVMGVVWTTRGPASDLTVITLAPEAARVETPVTNPQQSGIAGPVDALSGPPAAPVATAESDPAAPAQIISEADLLAYVPVPAAGAARVRAEWFVIDYFSSTDPDRAAKLTEAMGGAAAPPPADGPPTYVDWARALAAEEQPEGRILVTVLYRVLVTGEEGFRTGPVQAVEVPVAVSSDGGTVVTGLPAPVPLPAAPGVSEREGEQAEPPPEMLAQALEQIGRAAADPALVKAERVGETWRLWIEAADETGQRWTYGLTLTGGTEDEG